MSDPATGPHPLPTLQTGDLAVVRQGKQVLDAVNITVESGSVHGLVGPNGSGKSTLLHAVAGLIEHSGVVQRFGEVALMSGQSGYHPSRRLADHLRLLARQPGIDTEQLGLLTRRFGLTDLMQRAPRAMSLGQQRAVSLLAPLASTADLILLDEPFLALDAERVGVLESLIREYSSAGRTLLVSSHEPHPLSRVVTHVLFLRRGEVAFHGTMANLLDLIRPARVRVQAPEVAAWAEAALDEWSATIERDETCGFLLNGVTMSQVLDVSHQRRLAITGIWEESPTLEEALGLPSGPTPDPMAPAAMPATIGGARP